ncbi:hypothetical protein TWF718_002164 [Orbilia javanica]|uniref:Uncharacterized protein n=1 Tax=Orbilia javanica TaxID=47235 RepID=A0AAN8MJN6_9PEZI
MPPQRRQRRARSAPGQLHRAPYRRSPSPQPPVTTITVTAPITPTSGSSVQSPITPPEGSVAQVAADMPFDVRLFLWARRTAAGGSPSSSPFLLGEPRETASPRPRSPLQRRRYRSEPLPGELPVPLKKVSRGGVKKTAKKSSRQSGPGSSPRPNAAGSQRKSTKNSRATHSRRPTEAEAVRILDEAGSARPERSVRSGQRLSRVREPGQSMTPPSVRPRVAEQSTENVNGGEAGPLTRRSVRRGERRTGGTVRGRPLETPADDENAPQRGLRRTAQRRRGVTTNTGAPVPALSGQELRANGRVAPVGGELAPAASQEQGPRDRLLTLTNPAAEERYIQGLLQLRRRVEETFVPEGQQARAPAPQIQAPPRRSGLSEIPVNSLNNGPVVVGGREVRQGVVTIHRRPRQRPGARAHQDNLRGAFGL